MAAEPKKEKKVMYIRSSKSQPFLAAQPGRPPQEVVNEISACYVDDEEDVDQLIQFLATGRAIIGQLDVERTPSTGGRSQSHVVLTVAMLPTKVSSVVKGGPNGPGAA